MDRKKRGDLGKKSRSSKKKSSKKPHEIHLRRATSGEMIAKHRHLDDPGMDEEHIIPEGGLDQHAAEHLPAPQEAMAAPSPQPGNMLGGM